MGEIHLVKITIINRFRMQTFNQIGLGLIQTFNQIILTKAIIIKATKIMREILISKNLTIQTK